MPRKPKPPALTVTARTTNLTKVSEQTSDTVAVVEVASDDLPWLYKVQVHVNAGGVQVGVRLINDDETWFEHSLDVDADGTVRFMPTGATPWRPHEEKKSA